MDKKKTKEPVTIQKNNDETIVFNYIKTNSFETKFATGAYGGVNVTGHIHMDFYIDRTVIPQKTTNKLDENNVVVEPPLEIVTKAGIVREVHTSLLFDVNTAKEFVTWLNKNIQVIEDHNNKLNATTTTSK